MEEIYFCINSQCKNNHLIEKTRIEEGLIDMNHEESKKCILNINTCSEFLKEILANFNRMIDKLFAFRIK
jgi:hypothetical protein